MKILNRKGFTLIELLAVIVVLAVVLVVTVPAVLSSVRSAKLSQLHNLSVAVADWYNKAAESDKLGLSENILGDIPKELSSGKWMDLIDLKNTDGKSIADLYNLNSKDIYLNDKDENAPPDDKTYVFDSDGKITITDGTSKIKDLTSSIRIKDGKAEVLLIAREGGKFDTNGEEWTYALSSGTNAYDTVTDSLEKQFISMIKDIENYAQGQISACKNNGVYERTWFNDDCSLDETTTYGMANSLGYTALINDDQADINYLKFDLKTGKVLKATSPSSSKFGEQTYYSS